MYFIQWRVLSCNQFVFLWLSNAKTGKTVRIEIQVLHHISFETLTWCLIWKPSSFSQHDRNMRAINSTTRIGILKWRPPCLHRADVNPNSHKPVWTCDDPGPVVHDSTALALEFYQFQNVMSLRIFLQVSFHKCPFIFACLSLYNSI